MSKKKQKLSTDDVLAKLSQIESSGGARAWEHDLITNPKSMHYGTKAMGNWALMPRTVAELVKKNPQFASLKEHFYLDKYPDPKTTPIELEGLTKSIKQNPQLEYDLANTLIKQVKKNVGNNPELMAVGWHAGTSANAQQLQNILEEQSRRGRGARDYLQKWRNLQKIPGMVAQVPQLEEDYIYKASPTEQTSIESDETIAEGTDKWSKIMDLLTKM